MALRARSRIVVVGSVNMDLVVRAPRLPAPGETLTGSDFRCEPGGKGANQALAVARLGGEASLVACIGNDAFGAALHAHLADDGVDLKHVHRIDDVATGIASIIVSADGANSIVLAAGANAALSPKRIEASEPLIADAAMLLCQLEVPLETVRRAMTLAVANGTPVLLNPAPAQPLDEDLLRNVDYLVPNETEAALLCNEPLVDVASARRAARMLRDRGPRCVLITLGARGVWLDCSGGSGHFVAPAVQAVDTTAAGDTFIGAFASSLVAGSNVDASIAFAQRAAALCVTRPGAQASIPYRREVNAFLA